LLGRLWGGTANLEEVVERMPLVLHVQHVRVVLFLAQH